MKAIWNGVTIAESERTELVENNHYFPHDSIKPEYFEESRETSTCAWKGLASYYDVVVDGKRNEQAAWYYRDPSDAAANIQNHVAFWKGVSVVE